MDHASFDTLTRMVGITQRRRVIAAVLGSGALAALSSTLPGFPEAEAKKHRKNGKQRRFKKKRTLCLNGTTVRSKRKRRIRRWKRQGATKGACPGGGCTPVCTGCSGGSDGCGGTCPGCAAGNVCANDVCQPCTVTCNGDGPTCGVELFTEILAGGAVYVCPGTYQGVFNLLTDVAVYGAGSGSDPATSTILLGQPGPTNPVIGASTAGVTATFSNLRVTGAANVQEGGGVRVANATADITMRDCVITANAAIEGGGVAVIAGTLTIDGCEISNNQAASDDGGGVYVIGGACTITNTRITGNTAADEGGGLGVEGGTTTLAASVTITENTAFSGGGIYVDSGTVNLNGATVSENSPNDCTGITCL